MLFKNSSNLFQRHRLSHLTVPAMNGMHTNVAGDKWLPRFRQPVLTLFLIGKEKLNVAIEAAGMKISFQHGIVLHQLQSAFCDVLIEIRGNMSGTVGSLE